MKSQLFLCCLLIAATGSTQIMRRPVAASYIGLGSYSVNHIDAFSFTSNQACLARISASTAAVYAERKYMLKDLADYFATIALSTQPGNFGLKCTYAGSTQFNETQIGFAYARKMGTKADIGIQFNYNGIRISGYGNASAITCEAGAILHIAEKLHTGFHVNNPIGGKFGNDKQEKLPSVYTIGFGYDASEKFFFSAELAKEEDQPVNVNAGLQYKLISQLLFRAGISSLTSSTWFGFGLYLHSFRIDITTTYHPQLGFTPGLLLIFNFKGITN